MHTHAPNRIVELAEIVRDNVHKLDVFFTSAGLPTPSFDVDLPSELPPEIDVSRNLILIATDELQDLMLGPSRIAEGHPPQNTALVGIQAISRYQIASKLLPDEEISFGELAQRCGLREDDTRRILRQAISKHIFKEPSKGKIAHNAASRRFIDSTGLADTVWIQGSHIMPAAYKMLDAMDKWPGSEEHSESGWVLANPTSQSFYDAVHADPTMNQQFGNAMGYQQSSNSFGFAPSHLLDNFDWTEVKTMVDVGGSTGALDMELARRHPSITITVQDLPDVVANASEAIPDDLKSAVSFMPHDFFTEQPVRKADLYFFRWVFHNWSDKYAISILRNLIPALKHGSVVLVNEFCLPEVGTLPAFMEKQMRVVDLNMKALFNAKLRDADEWRELFSAADPRFRFQGAKVPMGSALAIITAKWEGAEGEGS